MTYLAYETGAGAAMVGVASLCRHAARAGGVFDSATVPSLTQVEDWLTESYYWIQGQLARHSLHTVQSGSATLSILQQLNVYDACCKVELSLPAESTSGEPNERFKSFESRRSELWEAITDGTLSALGAATVAAAGVRQPLITGISKSRKQTVESDDDATQHRIRRDSFLNPGTQGPEAELDRLL